MYTCIKSIWLSKYATQKHLEQIAPQFRKEILDGGTFTKMVGIHCRLVFVRVYYLIIFCSKDFKVSTEVYRAIFRVHVCLCVDVYLLEK